MKVLFVSSEAVPFAKTGGLADVAYALPKALASHDIDVEVIMPLYKDIPEKLKNELHLSQELEVTMNWRSQYLGIKRTEIDGIKYILTDNEFYFKRDGYYGHFDDGERFSYFCKAIIEYVRNLEVKPDIIHANDWHSAMVPLLLKEAALTDDSLKNIKTVFTIHNLKYQGLFPKEILGNLLDLNDGYFTPDNLEYENNVSFMKAGIIYSDTITTVSPTYSKEIQFGYYGEGLDGLIRKESYKLHGIVNGIDYDIYDPKEDKLIFNNYSVSKLSPKKENKLMLQRLLRLKEDPNIPIIAMVTRLVEAKGLDLISHILPELMEQEVQLVILGTGERKYEDMLRSFESYHPEKISSNIFFDNTLAHKIYSSSDMFLMPSKYEPCGIGQLIAMRYGTIPIVRQTGGLKDTVDAYNKYTEEGTGFGFLNYNAHELLFTIKDAISTYGDKKAWKNIMKQAMNKDLSWDCSADEYIRIYNQLME